MIHRVVWSARTSRNFEKAVGNFLATEGLTVLRIIHGSRDWPEGEWPAE